MIENPDTWKYQLSLKLGRNSQDMLNIRANDMTELVDACRNVASNAPEILAAGAAFGPVTGPPAPIPAATLPQEPRTAPAPAPYTPPPAQPSQGQEIGPVTYERVETTNGVKDGRSWTRYAVSFSNGVKASTFDGLTGALAQKLLGRPVFADLEKRGQYYNLLNLRPAA